MLYLVGAVLMSAALFLVFVAGRAANGASSPVWMQRLVFGNALALFATILLASGVAALLQAAFERGSATGWVLAAIIATVPFVALRLATRFFGDIVPAGAGDLPGAPPSGRPRRMRPVDRPAGSARGTASTRKAG